MILIYKVSLALVFIAAWELIPNGHHLVIGFLAAAAVDAFNNKR